MNPYNLPGEQVEPDASFWSRKAYLSTVTLDAIARKFDAYPYREDEEAIDLPFLEKLRDRRYDREFFRSTGSGLTPLSIYLSETTFTRRPPVGAVVSERPNFNPLIDNGAELATLFEAETPGLWHRHVLNVLLDLDRPLPPNAPPGTEPMKWREALSPPRQALYWNVLDTAIDSALAAVWHFKWLATAADPKVRDDIRFRRRPSEADLAPIVYDFKVERDKLGNIRRDTPRRPRPCPPDADPKGFPYPGTPRHPAYGSGHSTYSQAASSVMLHLFSDTQSFPPIFRDGWQALADNIGEARFWGGVHWRGDHSFGQDLGRAVAACVIEQLETSGVPTPNRVECAPPSTQDLEGRERKFGGPGVPGDKGQFRIDPNSAQGAQG
ncbi:MAG: hypothetical protein AVDCRST_MAG64-362 [uncultured Phycisphaerae bacterium]|uniref:Phosphatidic acid phosphatase type 2/haloperoxidase domain-containing protein n=1 Tax=uncultured Phycisphaerae bacterium TaxID=904963 RepID=A0A6J4N9Y0_9BACT|nr:MAG: hypothetical protein AVDCRST_MAG64-362 [uncultured Phycisphaerae bacterium]